jgi:RimJ/RimL family protein N-acetyltransferase
MTLSLKLANDASLVQLYDRYLRQRAAPFFIDVSGPPPMMRQDDFVEYCTENESWMLLVQRGKELAGCCHFRDKQFGLELANFDTVFFTDYPAPNSHEALAFGKAFRTSCAKQKLSRVQLLALKSEHQKIAFLESIGFKNEGVLREHYFFGTAFHDLVMLGWTTDDRSKRMAKLAEADGEVDATVGPVASQPSISNSPAPMKKSGIVSRRAEPRDIDLLIRWYGHPLIQETIEDEKLTPKGLRSKAKKLCTLDEFRDGECAFIVEFDGQPVALLHYMWIDWVSRTVELDYFLAPDLRAGPFLARMVIREIGCIAFEGLAMRKIYGFIYASNDTSVRMNASFLITEATLKNYLPHTGGGADVLVQSLLASDYYERYSMRQRGTTTLKLK